MVPRRIMRTRLMTILALAAPLTAQAGDDKPSAAIFPIRAEQGVGAQVQKRYDAKLREAMKAHASVQDVGVTDRALADAGFKAGACTDAKCFDKVAASSKARFIVIGSVGNTDDIYKVELTAYDAATRTTQSSTQECELCAADEVDKSIVAAVTALEAAFKVAPPGKATEPPPPLELVISSDPPGAEVTLDGKAVGQTPYKILVARGPHQVSLKKSGFIDEMKTVEIVDRAVTQDFLLQLIASNVTAEAGSPDETDVIPQAKHMGRNRRPLGFGLLIGGLAAGGAGGYFTNLEGKVTCTDGRGRRDCPNVYSTKWVGAALIGAGATALGAGLTLVLTSDDEGDAGAATLVPTSGGAAVTFGRSF